MADKDEKKGIPAFGWFLIIVAIYGIGAFYARVIPEDAPPAPAPESVPEVATSTVEDAGVPLSDESTLLFQKAQ